MERGFLSLFVTGNTASSDNLIATKKTTVLRFSLYFLFFDIFFLERPLPRRLVTRASPDAIASLSSRTRH